eukprot:NODE_7394_length_1583_cov_3.320055.p2 GENE.NODE_7394_length_1583_cov_3.320055~~NODE_7394_length_1583_cov_3.320055.p2  ORF type:complete len:256 (-),score=45.85 NODE_7394_length_1583_cov_3.320055:373-1140(-)
MVACEEGLRPTDKLRCLRGMWNRVQCVAHCHEAPTGIRGADVEHCAGTQVAHFCKLRCRRGLRSGGDLYCTEGAWQTTFCYDVGYALPSAVAVTLRIAGLHIDTSRSLSHSASSLHAGLARLLHIEHELLFIHVRRGEGGEREGGTRAVAAAAAAAAAAVSGEGSGGGEAGGGDAGESEPHHAVKLWILCDPCEGVAARCDTLLRPAFSDQLQVELCVQACPLGSACETSCFLEQRVRLISASKAYIASVESFDV